MKKIFVISTTLLGITLLFWGVYNFVFSWKVFEKSVTEKQKPSIETEKTTPKIAEKLKAISDEEVIGAVFDKKNGAILYYSINERFAWKIDEDGDKKQQISFIELPDLKNVFWSSDLSKTLAVTEKDGQFYFSVYDYKNQKATQLKSGIDTAVWNNLGTKIIYKKYDPTTNKRSINIADPEGNNEEKIADVDFRNVSISPIPTTALVSYWNYPNANEETKLTIIGVTGGTPRVILKGKYGADYLWSPDGTQALTSSLLDRDSKMTMLGLVKQNGKYINLNIPTIVSKCVWSNDRKTIYYALPGEIPDSAIMPNDYQNKKFFTDDTFWKIDIETSKAERIIEASDIPGKFDSSNLFLSPNEDALYFTNRRDGKLYKIDLSI